MARIIKPSWYTTPSMHTEHLGTKLPLLRLPNNEFVIDDEYPAYANEFLRTMDAETYAIFCQKVAKPGRETVLRFIYRTLFEHNKQN